MTTTSIDSQTLTQLLSTFTSNFTNRHTPYSSQETVCGVSNKMTIEKIISVNLKDCLYVGPNIGNYRKELFLIVKFRSTTGEVYSLNVPAKKYLN